MLYLNTLRQVFTVSLLSVVGTMALAVPGRASDYAAGSYDPRSPGSCRSACHYECITTYVPRTVSYTKVVTLYDHCGQPYDVSRTCYRTILVAVQKRVPVCTY
jgi:hypothetical protein